MASPAAMKVGKEEAIGMLMAVEMWVKRDHEAEWTQLDRLARPHRAARQGRSTASTTSWCSRTACRTRRRRCSVLWDRAASSASRAKLVARTLLDGEPRIALFPRGSDDRRPDRRVDHAVHARARRREDHRGPAAPRAVESAARQRRRAAPPRRRQISAGQWDVQIEYAAATSTPLAAPAAAGQRHRRHASGRLHLARHLRHDRRQHGAAPQLATASSTATP